MNSKLLIKQNRDLFDKLQIANLNCRRLTEENKLLKEKIDFLTSRLSDEIKNKSEVNEETNNEKDITAEKIAEGIEEPEETIVLSPEIEYGSKIIGEIVMSATQYSNRLSSEHKENIKELLNLILGRTEVSKAEILNIISSDVSFDAKVEMIDKSRDEAIEYFKSVMEQ